MEIPADPREYAEAMRRRIADWAAGSRDGEALNRQLSAQLTPDERLAEGVELTRIAEQLRASMRPVDER